MASRFLTRNTNKNNRTIRRKSKSPNQEDEQRIIQDYMKKKYLQTIVSISTAKKALESLTTDPLRGDTDDFRNFIAGINKKKLITKLFQEYGKENINKIKKSSITLKNGKKRQGRKINNNTYIIIINNKYLQARDYKTGKVKKIKQSYLY